MLMLNGLSDFINFDNLIPASLERRLATIGLKVQKLLEGQYALLSEVVHILVQYAQKFNSIVS